MRALLNKRVVEFPDPTPDGDRIVIRPEVIANLPGCRRGVWTLDRVRELVARRLHLLPAVVLKDGVKALIDKTMHMVRRENVRFLEQCASFVGQVVASPAASNVASQRVAGFALTHPAVTELVQTRKEHCWPVGPDCNPELASLIAYGGLACCAIEQARERGASQIGILGRGLLAELVGVMVEVTGSVPHRRERSEKAVFFDATLHRSNSPSEVSAWIVTPQVQKPIRQIVELAIGCGISTTATKQAVPNARRVVSCSLTEMLQSEDFICDLFYDDGPCTYPEWFSLRHYSTYVDLLPRLTTRLRTVPPRNIIDTKSTATKSATTFYSFAERTESAQPVQDVKQFPAIAPSKAAPTELLAGLIGAGRWGLGMVVRQLLRHPGVALRGVCDRRPEAAYLAKSALPFQYATTDLADILTDDQTGTVLVAPYHGYHGPIAAAALKSGKHCFVEKPPVISRAQFDELAEAAAKSDRILHVGYNRRFAPTNELLRKHIAQQEGPLTMNFVMRSIDIPKNNWYYWASNGNRVLSNVCHLIDYALFWVDHCLPVELTTTAAHAGREDENVVVTVGFEDGSLANILYTNRGNVRSGYFQYYVIACGRLIAENRNFQRTEVRVDGKVVARSRGVTDMGHRAQMTAFVKAIQSNGPPIVPLRDTLVSARTVLAAAEALETRKSVRLCFDEIPARNTDGIEGPQSRRAA